MKISKDKRARILKALADGVTRKETALRFQVSTGSIHTIILEEKARVLLAVPTK